MEPGNMAAFSVEGKKAQKVGILGNKIKSVFSGWVNGILINNSSVYGTLCIVLLKTLKMRLYFSEIGTGG